MNSEHLHHGLICMLLLHAIFSWQQALVLPCQARIRVAFLNSCVGELKVSDRLITASSSAYNFTQADHAPS